VRPTDAELASEALAGSQAAYRSLVARYAAGAVNLAARLVHDRALAEDLAQEAFVRAFARLGTYDRERRFSAWFFRILHNVTLDYLRRKRIDTVSLDGLQEAGYAGPESDAHESSPEAVAERRELTIALDRALPRIRPEYREALMLRYQQDLSIEEIAAILDVPDGTVKTYLHRGRKELAALMSAAGWGPDVGRR
jgi:RNA polymerase sigma-70 factor (ECF subfamily)